MSVMKLSAVLGDDSEMVIGYVCQWPSGEYWFNPKLPHRRSSRRGYATPEQAVPAWAKKMADRFEREGDPWVRNRSGAILGPKS